MNFLVTDRAGLNVRLMAHGNGMSGNQTYHPQQAYEAPSDSYGTASVAPDCEGYSNSRNFDQRRASTLPFTAIPIAFFWPTRTTIFLPLVMPV